MRWRLGQKSQIKLPPWTRPLLLVLAAASLVLLMCSGLVDWNNLFVKGLRQTLNDQVGYVVVGRNLADHGSLESNLVIPSVLNQSTTKNTLYMPGHYWLLGATYRALGFSVAHSFLPGILAFFASVSLLFVITWKLHGKTSAYYSCILFIFFPPNMIYSFTAMAEMPLVAAGLLAFAVFLLLPPRAKLAVGPLLVAIPLSFRETGALVTIPMAWMLFKSKSGGWKVATAFVLLSAMVVLLVLASPIGAGRPSLMRANVFLGGSFDAVYADAFAAQKVNAGALNWTLAIVRKFKANALDLLIPHLSAGVPALPEYFSVLFVLSGIPLGVVVWYKSWSDLGLAVALMVAAFLVLLLGTYTVWIYRGARLLLMTEPFVAALWGATVAQMSPKKLPCRAIQAVTLAFAVFGLVVVYNVFKSEPETNQEAARDTAFLESLVPDPRRLLVSPFWISLDYAAKHYPVRWSHVPANLETLKLLDRAYPIGTIVLPKPGATIVPREKLRPAEILAIGLVQAPEVSYHGITFEVFKRRLDAVPLRPSDPSLSQRSPSSASKMVE